MNEAYLSCPKAAEALLFGIRLIYSKPHRDPKTQHKYQQKRYTPPCVNKHIECTQRVQQHVHKEHDQLTHIHSTDRVNRN